MHTDIRRGYFHPPSKEEKYVELRLEMWSKECPEYERLRMSLYGTRDAAANGTDAYANVLQEPCPCSFYSRVRGIKIVVHGDDFISGGARHHLIWLEEVMDKLVESKHTVMGASSDLARSLAMLSLVRARTMLLS